jgi:hypothetical protein
MADPTTKAELLREMQASYVTFETVIAPLNDTQLTTSGVNGDWSIKDIVAHIATWQARAARSLEFAARDEEPQHDFPVNNEEEMHAFNAATFAANRSRPLSLVLMDFHASYQQLQDAVAALNEDALFAAGLFAWMDGDPLWQVVASNTFWHYPEHITMIEEWQARQGA